MLRVRPSLVDFLVWPSLSGTLVLLCSAACLPAGILTVGITGGQFDDLATAIEAASDGDSILVTAGEYTVRHTILLEGKRLDIRSESGPETTVIRLSDNPSDSRPFHHSLLSFFGSAPVVLEGFTLTGGRGIEASAFKGGAIYCGAEAAPIIRNCRIIGNQSEGGGVFCTDGSSPLFESCEIRGNTSAAGGGGVYATGRSRPLFRECLIAENTADGGGGAFCNDRSIPIFERCAFRRNASRIGGGLLVTGNSLAIVRECTVENNVAAQSGGGVYTDNSSPCLELCDIVGNIATRGGGVMFDAHASSIPRPALISSRVHGNSADFGGGISTYNSGPEIVSCLVSGNHARQSGGGIWLDRNSFARLWNLTLVANLAASQGGAIACDRGSPAAFVDSILWKNVPEELCIPSNNSLVGADPLFVKDVTPDFERFATVVVLDVSHSLPMFAQLMDYTPSRSSPAIDAGPTTGGVTVDLRGRDRSCAGRPDLGAVEVDGCDIPGKLFLRGDANQDGAINISDAVAALGFLFLGDFDARCLDSMDFDDDGTVDLVDPIAALYHLFSEGPSARWPAARCGMDLSADDLGCDVFNRCGT